MAAYTAPCPNRLSTGYQWSLAPHLRKRRGWFVNAYARNQERPRFHQGADRVNRQAPPSVAEALTGNLSGQQCDLPVHCYHDCHVGLILKFKAAGALMATDKQSGNAAPQHALHKTTPAPPKLWGDLFMDVQNRHLFADSKTFVDMVPSLPPETVLSHYRAIKEKHGPFSDEALKTFIEAHFVEQDTEQDYTPEPGQSISKHIDQLWPVLTRHLGTDLNPHSSRLPLPYDYVVPGGRFNEVYYWDSYFTMLGLQVSGLDRTVREMTDNFAFLIETYGHVPNGNRTYYLSRSQPPFFSAMVAMRALHEGDGIYRHYLPMLVKEYNYWMDGADTLPPEQSHRRVIKLSDGTLLNRYWDDENTPRPESFREDILTARHISRPHEDVWRNIRAAGESGWDFSSRWLADGHHLATIRTIDVAPVDLNCLMYRLEAMIARGFELEDNMTQTRFYQQRARKRRDVIRTLFWDDDAGFFRDYLWHERTQTQSVSGAMAFPLYVQAATTDQAERTARAMERHLLERGGLSATNLETEEQWDKPNGWAPLQWVSVIGLRHYGQRALARDIASRWIETNIERFCEEGKLIEKYNVVDKKRAEGGEYPAQDGFGWTNGVLRALMDLYPDVASDTC
ncbi:alpha,alpha-trehalase TreF [Larsenimonas suaedae]|uniref:Alpha,alpha-trehalase TreF n=1 Tax=Larsenimonas suaedae TaxID=1851019 RepID=A0ABU1GYM8_9GAMM|nr:alpha,alpha-trehalase TreF [Larsenimonas suaedae]MDR5897149.1 alpha,alpha-trehalase TreF [Larsenimonas suaedae]